MFEGLFFFNKSNDTVLKKIKSSIYDMICSKEKNGVLLNNTAIKFCKFVEIKLVNFWELILKRYLNWTYVWQRPLSKFCLDVALSRFDSDQEDNHGWTRNIFVLEFF